MRKQRPRGTITREAILDAGLSIVDRVGIAGLTIRAVAKQVGAPPMSLYSHFTNKDELLDLMSGETIRRLYPDQGHATWQLELFALCQHMRAQLLQHPRWTPLLSRPAAPVDVTVRERILALMVGDRIAPETAFSALSAASLSSVGFVLAELTLRGPEGGSSIEQRYEHLRQWSLDAPDQPVTRASVAGVPKLDLDATFSFALQALIRGFEAERAPAGLGS